MLFNSLEFGIFLLVVFFIYWLSKDRLRNLVVLLASGFFYASWNIQLFFIFAFEIIITYATGKYICDVADRKYRKVYFLLCCTTCIGLLFVFKYADFVISVINELNDLHIEPLNLVLPMGISFYTFQCIAYVIDVYCGIYDAEKNFIEYATFISFFPQLVAGPIERAKDILPQIKNEKIFCYEQATYGLKLMTWGYFKKIVIADTLAITIDKVWSNLVEYSGCPMLLATLYFGIQIYCDFSGYSDIARGTAKLFGIELSENFKSPYFSKSIKEFWNRWHITLSRWLRDYIYIPLGGSKNGIFKYIIATIMTFVISGVWHGANWTFIAWGGAFAVVMLTENAFYCIANHIISNNHKTMISHFNKFHIVFDFCKILLTNIVVFALWILFRSENLTSVIYIFRGLQINPIALSSYIKNNGLFPSKILGLDILLLFVFDYVALKRDVIEIISNFKGRWLLYTVFILFIYYQIPQSENMAFLYFQF